MPTQITTNQYGTTGTNGAYGNPNGPAGGNGGIGYSVAGSTVYNYAAIYGGGAGKGGGGYNHGGAGGSGGAGVDISAGTLVNETGASITGGPGGYGGFSGANGGAGGAGGSGGAGVDISAGALVNETGASITGGTGGTGGYGLGYNGYGGIGGIGGTGVSVSGSSTLTNNGSITGGSGGSGGRIDANYGKYGNGGNGGNGGAGVNQTGGTLTNSNQITGGNGGSGSPGGRNGYGGAGGAGGAGVLSSGTVTNTSIITGGNGGTGGSIYYFLSGSHAGNGGQGGAGVYLNGGTLTTSGTISGGQGGQGGTGYFAGANGANGDAVQFGTVASTLVVKPHAVFNGQVAANTSVNDVLKLSGTQSGGTRITLGTQFTGFSTLTFASGAHWTVDASAGAAPSSGLTINGFTTSDTIDVTNLTPSQVAADFNPSTHVLTTPGDGTLHFDSAFSGEYFVFSNDGGTGTDITLATGPITTTLLYTVTLGSASFTSPLTITSTGGVAPAAAGATGLVSSHSTNSLTNNGTIQGGAGAAMSAANGGFGVNLTAGTVTNTGSISGGTGGTSSSSQGGHGGAGVLLDGGTLTTSGTLSGGAGGTGTTTGAAGDAVQFGSVASTLIVDPGAVFTGAIGGFGLVDTIDIANLTPTQVAADFNPTTHVLTTPGDGTLDFSGAFSSEYFVFSNDGGTGTDITLATGSGISTTLTSTVTVGSAAHPSPLTITSTGVVAPTAAGATGLVSSHLTNSLTNNGAIQGGAGAAMSAANGGFGVNLTAGTVTNTGSISGGTGGTSSSTQGGHGGAGVDLNGGTLITSGTISGGVGGAGTSVGASGDAVQFGTATSTLIVDPGAVFNGQVVGNASVHDVLELSGTQVGGTAITLGTQFTNFSMLEFAPGATGTVDATVADLTSHPLSVQGSIAGFGLGDTLDITNLVHSGTTYNFDAATEILSITKGATMIQLGFDSAFTGEHFVLASNGHGGTDVTLQTGAASEPMALHGFSSHAFTDHGLAHDASVMMS